VQGFYDVTHRETVETESAIRNVEAEIERQQEAHRTDVRVRLRRCALPLPALLLRHARPLRCWRELTARHFSSAPADLPTESHPPGV
jgi:hypothetical protein